MSIRDLALIVLILGAIPFMLKRPFVGLLFWVWVGVMNPHQLAWGVARTMSFAMIVAIATFVGILFNRSQLRFKGGVELGIIAFLFFWMSVTTVFAFNTDLAYVAWERVAKIQLMVLVAFFLVNAKWQLDALLWVIALSVGYFGAKGGLFTLLTGGSHRVYGPGDSVIGDNNSIALATVMIIPLLVYLRNQAANKWLRLAMLGSMVLCAASVLGSQSRGALLAVSSMLFFLWLKSRRKMVLGLALLLLVPPLVIFMPDSWTNRMQTIETYQEDSSAMQRINSWTTAINIANDRPLVGGGFNLTTPITFARYSPRPEWVLVAHSIYFQILGEHGWVGLALFLGLWGAVWRRCSRLIKTGKARPELLWAWDLGSMLQVSLVGYLVGGAFLSLAYWDVPYYLVVAVVVAHWIVRQAESTQNAPRSVMQARGSNVPAPTSAPRQRTT